MIFIKKNVVTPIEFDESLIRHSINFEVPGKPRGKERPRTVRMGNRITTYTPKNTVEYENLVRKQYKNASNNVKMQNKIEANLVALFEIPKSVSKKERERILSGDMYYTKKPDVDNINKIILDALNKVAYEDDSQVCKVTVIKKYCVDDNPMVKINLKEI